MTAVTSRLHRPARAAGRAVLVLVAVSATTHFLLSTLPGDAVHARLGLVGAGGHAAARRASGLDDPALERFVRWLGDASHGDLGSSLLTGIPVTESIAERLPITLELVVGAQIVAVGIAVAASVAGARDPGNRIDRVAPVVSLAVLSLPTYLVGVVLLSVFSVRLGWFPVSDVVALGDGPLVDHVRSMVLPVAALALPEIAMYQRSIRTGLAAARNAPFVVAAFGRGLPPSRVVVRHTLPTAATAPLAMIAPTMARSIGGAVLVEQIFSIPGIGRYALDAIRTRDEPAILGSVVIVAALYLLTTAGTELARRRLDPSGGR